MADLKQTDTGITQTIVIPSSSSSLGEDLGPQLNVLTWLLTAIATGWLVLRIYCKLVRHRRLWWDDWFLITAWMALLLSSISGSFAVHFNFGKPITDVPPSDFPRMFMTSNLVGACLILAAMWSKTSFAFTMLRIAKNRWIKMVVWFIIISMNVSMGPTALLTLIHCWPLEKTWDFRLAGSCLPPNFIIYLCSFTSGYSGSMDIVLALLPWKIIWELDMSLKERLGAILAMSMGIFAGITSLIKIYAIRGLVLGNASNAVQLSVLSTVEAAITIMAACIPILRALARDKPPLVPNLATAEATERRTWRSLGSLTRTRTQTISESSPDGGSASGETMALQPIITSRNSSRGRSIIGFGRTLKTKAKKTAVLSHIVEADEVAAESQDQSRNHDRSRGASLV